MLYPIGIQSFEKIRQGGYVYVDKTGLIYKIAKTGQYYFLSRPRRFGKSLLLSTMEAYFRGRKELFDGLAIASLEKDWTEYPVLHLDLGGANYADMDALKEKLGRQLNDLESEYGVVRKYKTLPVRFETIIEAAYRKTGRQVVILVDEYDKPVIDNLDRPELQDKLRETLRGFYGVMKSKDAFIRFGFLNFLLGYYAPTQSDSTNTLISLMSMDVESGNPESFMTRLDALFARTNYQIQGDCEKDFQYAMYIIIELMGEYVETERTTSNGRIDILIKTKDYVYIIEIKTDSTPDEALAQIEEKGYARPFADDPRRVFRIGVNFSTANRRIDGWKVIG